MTCCEPQALLERYSRLLRSEAKRYRVESDDLSQQVACHLIQSAKSNISMPLLVRRAAHEVAGLRRKRIPRRDMTVDEFVNIQDSRLTSNTRIEVQDELDALLTSASPVLRRVIAVMLTGRKFGEAAAQLGLNDSTARSLFRRFAVLARQALDGELN